MRKVLAIIASAVALTLSSAAVADSYHVQVWHGAFNQDNANAPPPSDAPLASFDFVTDDHGIQWSSQNSLWNTYGDLFGLGGDPGTSLTGFTATNPSLTAAGFLGSSFYDGTNLSFFEISGTFNNDSGLPLISVLHNAGATLYVDTNRVFYDPKAPGSGQTTNSSFVPSAASGAHSFDLFYIAAGGNPSILTMDLPNARGAVVSPAAAVPEPASLALLGIGLAGLGFARRRGRH